MTPKKITAFLGMLIGASVLAAAARAPAPLLAAVSPNACGMQMGDAPVAFCETFDAPSAVINRSGQLNGALWGVSRIGGLQNLGQSQYNSWKPDSIVGCNGVMPDSPDATDVIICNGQVREAMNDNHGVTALAMYPKQPFDFTGRTGTISFDVSNDTFGTHDAWPEVWITDQPVPAPMAHFQPCDTCSLPRNGVGIRLASFLVAGQGAQEPNCPNDANGHWFPDSVVVTRNYIQQEFPMIVNNVRQTTGCVTSSPGPNGPLNHVEIRISQNQVDVWASDAGSTALKHLASIPNLNLSFTKGVVWLEDVHYNASKAFGASGTADGPHTNHTFTWDNLAFDGPSVARDFTLDVHDAQSACCGGLLNLGFNSSPSSPAKLTTDPATAAQIAAASAALLVFTFSYDPITTFNYTVNGRAFSAPSPFTPQTASSKSLALPIPLTALVPGPQQITIAGDTGMIVSNVDVILVGAGGGGGTTAPPPPPPDAGPPPPADGGVALAPSPAGLAGTAKATVNVTWTAVSGATGYVIRRGTSATGAFTTVGTPTQPSFSDTTVAFATTYLYTVATVNAAGEGAESNPISVPVP